MFLSREWLYCKQCNKYQMKNERPHYSKKHKAWSAKSVLFQRSSQRLLTPCRRPRPQQRWEGHGSRSHLTAPHGPLEPHSPLQTTAGQKPLKHAPDNQEESRKTMEGFAMVSVAPHLCQAAVPWQGDNSRLSS